MLRVANKGVLFKVYRGVPLTFAMTSLAARGCPVGNVGGCWTEIFSPPMSRPVLKHGPRSSTCVRVDGRGNPVGARKLTDGILEPQ